MEWTDIIKFNFKPDKPNKPNSKKTFTGFGSGKGAKDTMKDFDIADFPRDACSSWQPYGRGCHNKAEWACVTCGAQWCDEHRFSGMDGHTEQVYIGDDPNKQGERIGRYERDEWERKQREKDKKE